jgi:hypothetical protein
MAQFLLITTLFSVAGLIATSIMGWTAAPGHYAQHIFFSLGTVVLGLFSQSMTMFFFIGTGKEIKEAAAGDTLVIQKTKAFKSRVFPAAMYAMLAIMVTFIMGGGVPSGKTPWWLHLALSLTTVVLYARAYWIELQAMQENAGLMEKYLREE